MKKLFVTGTDTGVGKTYFTCQYLKHLNQQGLKTAALKPISAGCEYVHGQLKNEDALLLQKTCSIHIPYEVINPIALEEPTSPHIQRPTSTQELCNACQAAFNLEADILVIEGAGGWFCPISESETLADFVKCIDADIILVVGLKLGCLNHAILTYQAIQSAGLSIEGWVPNPIDPHMLYQQENIDLLSQKLGKKFIQL